MQVRKVAPENLAAIVEALLGTPPARQTAAAHRLFNKIADQGWAESWLIEDLLYATDARLNQPFNSFDLDAFGEAIDLRPSRVTARPRARSNGAVLASAWSAFDTAALLINLADLGLLTDPDYLVARLRPTIPKSGLITNSQLDVLWYERCRGKRRVDLESKGDRRLHTIDDIRLESGHRAEIHRDADGAPIRLTVYGPKFRRLKVPVETKCSEYGEVWFRGDPDSSAAHRRIHRTRMVFLDPKPDPQMLLARQNEDNAEHVDWLSPDWKQQAMNDRATIFRRETGYSFVGWGAKYERDAKAQGYLFTREDGSIVGACVFRWREYSAASPDWALQWVWVCPKARRSGVLRSRWPMFRERFGGFHVEGPISDSMQAFLAAIREG
jgi:hypothetical protein